MSSRSSPAPGSTSRKSTPTPGPNVITNKRAPPPSSSPAPSPAPSTPPAPLPPLSTLLNHHVQLTLTPLAPSTTARTLVAQLWSYDAGTSIATFLSPSTTSTPNPHSILPSSHKYNFHFIPTSTISALAVLPSPSTSAPLPSLPSTSPSAAAVEAAVNKAVAEDAKERARVGKGVTGEAQDLFDALGRTLPVRWSGKEIVVMDEVIIREPYGVADVKGAKGSEERVERVKKVLEGERQRRLERQSRTSTPVA